MEQRENNTGNQKRTGSNNTLKRSYTMIKWDSSQGCKDGTIFANHKHNTSHKTQQRQKSHDHINRC